MSQDDQRNQPNEEPAEAAAARRTTTGATAADMNVDGAGVGAAADAADLEGTDAAPAGAPTAPPAEPATTAPSDPVSGAQRATARREFREAGEGAPRYAAVPEAIPRSGSEESWSAEPNPGYQRDPAVNYTGKRVIAGTLIGALLMAGFVVYAARILTNRSGNGFGSAAWTASNGRDGAALGGINAQNNGAPHEVPLPADVTFGDSEPTTSGVMTAATASCRTASAITLPVTAATGTPDAIRTWSAQAAAAAQKLHTDAATLQNVLNLGHADAVASAANTLCLSYPTIAALPPMPDAVGSQAWSSAVSSYATAANEALQAVGGNPNAKGAALDALNRGDQQLAELSARINSVA